MLRLTLAAFSAFLAVLWLALRLGGAQGGGALAGYLLGAGLSGLGFLYQVHVLATRPARALAAQVTVFLVKLGALLMGACAFRYVGLLAERVDWQAFVIAYAAAVALILPLAAAEAVRQQRVRSLTRPVQTPS